MKSEPVNTVMDALSGVSEVALDSIIEDGFLKDIPLVGTALGVARTCSSVRDQLFLYRVKSFIEGCRAGKVEGHNFALGDEKKSKRVGETLLFILDSASSTFKAELLGHLFAGLVEKRVDIDFFEHASEAVHAANSCDLRAFVEEEKIIEFDQRDHMRNLSNQGFTRPYGDDTFENIRSIYYELTDLGRTFLSVMGSPATESKSLGIRDNSARPSDPAKIYSAVRTGNIDW